MDKDKHSTSKPGDQPQSSTNTLRKSKRRNRKKKPSTVAVDTNQAAVQPTDKPVAGKPSTIIAPAPPVAIAPINPSEDLPATTSKVLLEVKNALAQLIPAMEKKQSEDKERDQVKAEREAKRLAKKNKKQGVSTEAPTKPTEEPTKAKPAAASATSTGKAAKVPIKEEKKEQAPIQKALPAKNAANPAPAAPPKLTKSDTDVEISAKLEKLHLTDKSVPEKVPLTKAERRAIQEAQRATKAKVQAEKVSPTLVSNKKAVVAAKDPKDATKSAPKVSPKSGVSIAKKTVDPVKRPATHRVKLFSHLYLDKQTPEDLLSELAENTVHPALIQLGVQQSQGTIIGANSRCIAFLNALKMVIADFVPPPQKILSRSLEGLIQSSMVYLQKCRPISVSMSNALKAVKGQINHLPDNETDEQHKDTLCEFIDTYIRDQIEKAAVAISTKVQEKIFNGDVILTYGCSSLIKHILDEAHRRNVDFRVIVVDSRPLNEGQEMLRRLTSEGIRCTCVQINAVSFVMPEVTKVLLGAHALLANGYVMSRTGTAQVAMVAKSYNVPVLVCCETHKFSERVQTDAFVYNEIGDPNDLVKVSGVAESALALKGWQTMPNLTPLHLYYDITPPELVAAVVTEVAILPCTSVPVILRIKPTEVWY